MVAGSTVDWSDKNVETLKAGVAVGDSYAQIARRIPRCTRCAAIGKAKRLGLLQPSQPARPTRALSAPAVGRVANPYGKDSRAVALRIAGRGTVFEQAAGRAPRVVIPFASEPSGKRTVLTICAHECRWPIGDPQDPGFTLCGEPCEGAYCGPHRQRAFTSEETRKWVDRKLAMPLRARFS